MGVGFKGEIKVEVIIGGLVILHQMSLWKTKMIPRLKNVII